MQQVSFEEISQLLQQNGFTKNDAEVYLAILKLKKSNAIEVAEKINIDKTTVYRAIESLSRLGLIASTGGRYNNQLFVKDINKLPALLEQKRASLDQGLQLLNSFVEQLPIKLNEEYLHSKVTVLQGDDVVKDIYNIRHEKPNSLIREISSDFIQTQVGNGDGQTWNNHEYWNWVIEQRRKQGCFLHLLVDSGDESEYYHRTSDNLFKEARVVPDDFKITAGMNIFGNKVAIHNTKTVDVVGIIIDDVTISTLCASFFDFVWKRSKII
jgi:sugar-specific transcriptional regulator TrmB